MKLKDILKICEGKLICGNEEEIINDFSKDTRTIKEGDLYMGIKGENYDGNTFYLEALNKGAKACILDNESVITKNLKNIVLVKDSIEALHKLAEYKRKQHNIKVIAVTGSVGKTTTKELIYNMLKNDYKVLKTEKNYNGKIGLPLTVLKLNNEEILLVEMGMNEKGGIDKLSKIVKPDIAVITNIGTSHIGNLGSREEIMNAKLEILNHMNKDGILIINNDNDLLNKKIKELNNKIITYGINNKSDYIAHDIRLEENKTTYKINNEEYEINISGLSTVYNSLVSIIIGDLFNIKDKKNKIKNIELTNNRLEIKNINNIKIIDDTYNASYESVVNAIDTLKIISKKRKIVVLGDILELGEYSKQIHEDIGKYLKDIDILITIGNDSKYINDKANIKEKYHFNNIDESYNKIKNIIKKEDTILFKASHSMNFKKLVDKILNSIN